MIKIRVNGISLLIYGFVTGILALAGFAFGKVLFYLFLLLVLFPLVSFLHSLSSVLFVRFHQDFNCDHLVKGETILYKLIIENDFILPAPFIRVEFKELSALFSMDIEPLNLFISGKSTEVKEYQIRCPYRGIYTIGLKAFIFNDALAWISVLPPVFHKTFYIYPRTIILKTLFIYTQDNPDMGRFLTGTSEDNTLFDGLKGYRDGMPVKNIYWKKFMATGTPNLKRFDASSIPGCDIYLDLRRDEKVSNIVLEREDCSIEISVALVKYLLDRMIPVNLYGASQEFFTFHGKSSMDFAGFHQAMITLFFDEATQTGSPAELYRTNRNANIPSSSTLFFITHTLDPGIFELCAYSKNSEAAAYIILNQVGMREPEKIKAGEYVRLIREKGGSIICIEDPDSIKEELEGKA